VVAGLVVVGQNPVAGAVRLLLIVAGAAAAGFAVNTWLVAPARNLYHRDDDALVGIVTVLRDVVPHLMKREGWETDRIEVTMQRLERFPVGPRKL
jgi:hypothetical protein